VDARAARPVNRQNSRPAGDSTRHPDAVRRRWRPLRAGAWRLVVVAAVAGAALVPGLAQTPAAAVQNAPASAGIPAAALVEDLVAANRILAQQGVVDGFGHVSVRHDRDANRFLLARSMAPELVTAADIMEFDLESLAVDPRGRAVYSERFIHGEIYRARPDVRAVVHHHAPSVIPFGVTGTRLRPVYHMAGFLGAGIPLFEIRSTAGMTDMLVSTPALGRALADVVDRAPAALMRGHGAVVVGETLPIAVGRSIYLDMNARMQLQAMTVGTPVTYLDPEEARRIVAAGENGGYQRPWELWKRRALADVR
jgi:ribulose-5-phosphate 4-epimerase/fuculose-1-phosphate aldolase